MLSKKGFKKPLFEVWLEKQKTTKAKRILRNLRKPLKRSSQRAKNSPKSHLKRGSMTKPIPLKMREELAKDPFMKECCLKLLGDFFECKGEIQWHHNLIYAGKRINEKGTILPLCKFHHEKESKYKILLNTRMYNRMSDADRAKYPRKKWL